MASTIWKHRIEISDDAQEVEWGEIRHIGITEDQRGIYVWVEHEYPVSRGQAVIWLAVHGTGHVIPDNREFVGTVVAEPFVWHVFKVTY